MGRYNINCTVSAYNILYTDDLMKWSRKLSRRFCFPVEVHFNMLHQPVFQHISVLTEKLNNAAVTVLNDIKKNYTLSTNEENGVNSLMFLVKSWKNSEEIKDLRKKLRESTLTIDKWRRENFFSLFPEFKGEL